MKDFLFLISMLIGSTAYSQLGVAFHQSNLPFVGLNYEFNGRIRPELRIGIDNYFEDLSVEGIGTYDFIRNSDYEFYGGLGIRVNSNTGALVIPVGLNVYPFTQKQFGFHIELAPIIEESAILRGSWGIRYRFKKRD